MRPLAELLITQETMPPNAETGAVHGIVEAMQSRFDIASLTDELHSQISQYACPSTRVVLIGHSWGAWLATIYAAHHPQSLRRIILIGTPPFDNSYADMIRRRREARMDRTSRTAFRKALHILESRASVTGNAADTEQSTALRQIERLTAISDNVDAIPYINDIPFDYTSYAAVWAEAQAIRSRGEWHTILRNVQTPATVIHGDSDPHPVEGAIIPMTDAGIACDVRILPRCGHTPFLERHAARELKRILLETISRA